MKIQQYFIRTVYGATAFLLVACPFAAQAASLTWTAQTAVDVGNPWHSVTYGNGTFVAVSSQGTHEVMSSPDGVTWTGQAAAADDEWFSVTYGNGTFVAVSISGKVMTSPDGVTWTGQTAAEANEWFSVTYGNGTFVAVAANGTHRVMTSPDGVTWTAQTAAEANQWVSVTYGNGTFVALAVSGTHRVMTSPDGVTWTAQTAAEANSWISAAYGNGTFVAIAQNGTHRVMTSLDGVTWTAQTAAEANQWQTVTYGSGIFVALANSGTHRVMVSSDGVTWTAETAAESNDWQSIAYGNNVFAAVAESGTHLAMTGAILSTITTQAASSITGTSVIGNGTVTDTGGTGVLRGFSYGTTTAYGTDLLLDVTHTTGAFSGSIDHLACGTTYHYAASGQNAAGISYGSDQTFTTDTCAPTAVTQAASSVAQTSIMGNGTIIDTGGDAVTARGFAYGTTAAYGATTTETGSFSAGDFSGGISGLSCGTAYHYAAYAVNSVGTSTEDDAAFTTGACTVAAPAGNGMVFTGSASALPGYIAPRAQVIHPDGTVAYLDAATSIVASGETQPSATAAAFAYQFTRNLQKGMSGPDILALQQYLNAHGFPLAASGSGSPGQETEYFGVLTRAALIAFQDAQADQILTPIGLTEGTGYFGPSTRALVDAH